MGSPVRGSGKQFAGFADGGEHAVVARAGGVVRASAPRVLGPARGVQHQPGGDLAVLAVVDEGEHGGEDGQASLVFGQTGQPVGEVVGIMGGGVAGEGFAGLGQAGGFGFRRRLSDFKALAFMVLVAGGLCPVALSFQPWLRWSRAIRVLVHAIFFTICVLAWPLAWKLSRVATWAHGVRGHWIAAWMRVEAHAGPGWYG